MALEGIVEKLDGSLLKLHTKLGESWQNTGRSKKTLERNLYLTGSVSFATFGVINFGLVSLSAGAISLLTADNAYDGKLLGGQPRTGFNFNNPDPGTLYKGLSVGLYALSAADLLKGIADMGGGIIAGDENLFYSGLSYFTMGMSFLSVVSAGYVHRVDMGEPPPRSKKLPLKERMRNKYRETRERVREKIPDFNPPWEPVPAKRYSF